MKIDQLIYFLETAKHLHVGKAARSLAISPSAVSHSISTLEEELGRPLINHQGKRISLTAHGKLLAEKAEVLVKSFENLKRQMAVDEVMDVHHYRLAASHVLCEAHLTPVLAQLQMSTSGISTDLLTLRSADVVSGVSRGEFDLGICFSPQDHPQVTSEKIAEGQLVVCVRKDHPILKKPKTNWATLLNSYPAVMPKAFQGIEVCETHPVFKTFGIEPRPDCYFDSYGVAVQKILNSDSWGFLPDCIVKGNIRVLAVNMSGRDWNAPYRISALWPRERTLTPFLKSIVDKLRSRLAE